MISVRASSLPRIHLCPGSALLDSWPSTNPAARAGTAAHAIFDRMVNNLTVGEPEIEAAAREQDVETAEVRSLFWGGFALWDSFFHLFPNPETEVAYELEWGGLQLTGHADIVCVPGDGTIRVGDWKTGRKKSNFLAQLRTYAWMAWQNDGAHLEIHTIWITVLWTREREAETYKFTRREIENWGARLLRLTAEVESGELVANEHCGNCPVKSCGVRSTALAAFNPEWEVPTTRHNLAERMNRVDAIAAIAKQAKETLKGELRFMGPVPCGDGKVKGFRTVEKEDTKGTEAGFEVLTKAGVPLDVLRAIASPPKTEIKRVLDDVHRDKITAGELPKGSIGKATAAVMDELRTPEVGMITKETTEKLDTWIPGADEE